MKKKKETQNMKLNKCERLSKQPLQKKSKCLFKHFDVSIHLMDRVVLFHSL